MDPNNTNVDRDAFNHSTSQMNYNVGVGSFSFTSSNRLTPANGDGFGSHSGSPIPPFDGYQYQSQGYLRSQQEQYGGDILGAWNEDHEVGVLDNSSQFRSSQGNMFQQQHRSQQHQHHQNQQDHMPGQLGGELIFGNLNMQHSLQQHPDSVLGGLSSNYRYGAMGHQQQQHGQQPLIQQLGHMPLNPMGGQYNSSSVGQSRNNRSYSTSPSTGGSNAQGRALNKMLLEILKERVVDPNRLALAIDAHIERMDCVNLATLLFHTGKKKLLLTPSFIKRIATRFSLLKEELRAREASNALYGLKCMSSECLEVRQLVYALAQKVAQSTSDLVAQAVGNALYGMQMMTSDYDEVKYLLQVLAMKVGQCTELLEAQNVGNALYGLRGMNSDNKEVRALIAALTPKVSTAREDLNGQALGNSLYGMQCMSSKEPEVRALLVVLGEKVTRTWEDLKAQEVGNALYGLKRMSSDVPEVRQLIDALVPKIAASPEILDAQAIGNSFYGMQNMRSDNSSVLALLNTMAEKVSLSMAELDGQAMGNSLYGLQGMNSEHPEVRAVVSAITEKLQSSCLEMNAQELGNALYGLQNMTSDFPEVRRLASALTQKVASSKHDLTSQEIGNSLFGLQGMRSEVWETRMLVRQMAMKITQSHSLIDPQGIANSLLGIQNMSSECEEVRLLIQALASKIESSWKLLSAQHIASALFGLQNLTCLETEVSSLIHALVPKVLSCRDEMSAKQVACSFFGLQNMYSQHEDVKAIVAALAEKTTQCTEPFTGQHLSAALFGLQGMDDSSPEVRQAVSALAEKAAGLTEIDTLSIGNCFFGLQRMSTNYEEVCTLLDHLAALILGLTPSGDGLRSELNAQSCASIVYGLQNCNCSIESVRSVLTVVAQRIKELVNIYMMAGSQVGNKTIGGKTNTAARFSDVLCLFQSLSLALLHLPGLDLDPELRDTLLEQQIVLAHIVENRKQEHKAIPKSVPESRLCEGMTTLLINEPLVVNSGELLWGFESTLTVRFDPSLQLTMVNGEGWMPTLNVEVLGSSHSFPAKELFTRLRNRYLFEQKGVAVEMIPSALLAGSGQTRAAVIEVLKRITHLFNVLFPPSMEDSSHLSNTLQSLGAVGPGGLLSTVYSRDASGEVVDDAEGGARSFFSSNPLGDSPNTGIDLITQGEYIDDNFEADFFDPRIPTVSRGGPKTLRGMNLHWIGDAPTLSPAFASSSHHSSVTSIGRVASEIGQMHTIGGANILPMQGSIATPGAALLIGGAYGRGGIGDADEDVSSGYFHGENPRPNGRNERSTSGAVVVGASLGMGASMVPMGANRMLGSSPTMSSISRMNPMGVTNVNPVPRVTSPRNSHSQPTIGGYNNYGPQSTGMVGVSSAGALLERRGGSVGQRSNNLEGNVVGSSVIGGLSYPYFPPGSDESAPGFGYTQSHSSNAMQLLSGGIPTGSNAGVQGQNYLMGRGGAPNPSSFRPSPEDRDIDPSQIDVTVSETGEDGEIALLEAQLEIKRMEAQLLQLKKKKTKPIG